MAKAKSRDQRHWIFPMLFVAGTVVVLYVVLSGRDFSRNPFSKDRVALSPAEKLQKKVDQVFVQFAIQPEWITRKGRELRALIPGDLHPLLVYQQIAEVVRAAGGTITQGNEDVHSGVLTLTYALAKKPVEKISLIPDARLTRKTGMIAIVVDDFGYNRSAVVEKFLDLPFAVTYSIIPGLPYSKKIAEEIHDKRKPIMVHMPMEPMQGKVESDGYTLLTTLPPPEIARRMREAIAAIPFANGVNNHMGSKATTDSLLLQAALVEIKKAGYFFLDSRTSQQSMAFDLAQADGVPALRNNLFIDAEDGKEHIEQKLNTLVEIASREKFAIGICHPRPNTLEVLLKIVPQLEARGYVFVHAEALLQPYYLTSKN